VGLFDKGIIPAGMQSLIVNLVKSAAPELVEQVDALAQLVRQFKLQLDRIEAQLNRIEEQNVGHGQQTAIHDARSGSDESADARPDGLAT
jgi:hypothetical protein